MQKSYASYFWHFFGYFMEIVSSDNELRTFNYVMNGGGWNGRRDFVWQVKQHSVWRRNGWVTFIYIYLPNQCSLNAESTD